MSTTTIILASAAVLLAVTLIAFLLGRGGSEEVRTTPGTTTSTTDPRLGAPGAPTLPPSQLTTFSDEETGFTIQYPRSWTRIDAPVRDVRFIATSDGNDYVSVRVLPVDVPATAENLGNFKAFTDGVVTSNPSVKVLKQQQITLNGMLGYYYLYTFRDDASGQEGAHAHYFLFQGRKMNIIVFQALPTDGFARLASIFDQMAASFQSDPNRSAIPETTAPSTTTAGPPETTVP